MDKLHIAIYRDDLKNAVKLVLKGDTEQEELDNLIRLIATLLQITENEEK